MMGRYMNNMHTQTVYFRPLASRTRWWERRIWFFIHRHATNTCTCCIGYESGPTRCPPSKCYAIPYLLKIAVGDITVSAALPLKVYIFFFIKFLSTFNKQMQLLHCKFCIFIQSYLKRPDNLFIYRSNKCIMPCALNKFKLEPFQFFFLQKREIMHFICCFQHRRQTLRYFFLYK